MAILHSPRRNMYRYPYRTAAEVEMEPKERLITRFNKWRKENDWFDGIVLFVMMINIIFAVFALALKSKNKDEAAYDVQQNALVSESQLFAGQWLYRHGVHDGIFYARPHKCAHSKNHCAGFVDVLGATIDGKDVGHFTLACKSDTRDCYIMKD